MSSITIDYLRRDEAQPAATAQMNNIKSQFHPSNTANVNIVPYEIYDEDGVERVVGEVRKTIDGVKKKKPVYRKIYIETVSSRDASIPISTLSVDDAILLTWAYKDSRGSIGTSYYMGTNDYIRVAIENGNLRVWSGNSYPTTSIDLFISIEYTKTTDEWTAI